MKIFYDGPCADGVYIADTDEYVPKGGVVDVSDELGKSLLEQVDTWKPVVPAKAAAKAAAEKE